MELANHVLARHSYTSACKGPADYNCEHGDLLYIYKQAGKLKALYLDTEGHVIHYDVATPEVNTAVFLSDGSMPGPQFRLTYALKSDITSSREATAEALSSEVHRGKSFCRTRDP